MKVKHVGLRKIVVCTSFLNLLMIVITDEEFWSTGVAVEVLDKKDDV
jgi:hypothetical protein